MGILKEKRIGVKTLKIIACLSQKGGGGKSTLARCLSVELTKKHKVLLVRFRHSTKNWPRMSRKTQKPRNKTRYKLSILPLLPN